MRRQKNPANLRGYDLVSSIDRRFDPGIAYQVVTPSGVRLTQCKPAGTEGSACMVGYFAHHYTEKRRRSTE